MVQSAVSWTAGPRAGSRVVVTGAAGGLGRTLVTTLASNDIQVAGIDRPGACGPPGLQLFDADLTDDTAAQAAIGRAADALGGIDALVGAAGVVDTVHRASAFPLPEFRAEVETNMISQFVVAQAAYPALRQADSPAIVFLSSVAAEDGLPGQVGYAAAKAGVLGLTRSLAAEWAADRIRVNAVVPGLFATPKVLSMPDSARERLLSNVPMNRVASIEEVVGSIMYLLSPAAGYVTGQALRLDGGAALNHNGLYR